MITNFILFLESKNIGEKSDIKKDIQYARLPKEYKDIALEHLKKYSSVSKGKIFGLSLHKDLKKLINDKDLPSGFDMGLDKNGFFIHTNRARSKSFEDVKKIPIKSIRFVDSTG